MMKNELEKALELVDCELKKKWNLKKRSF